MEQLVTGDGEDTGQSSLLGVMWRYRWAVLLVLVGSIAFGLVINDIKTVDYVATAELIVEDPRASSLEVTDFTRQSTQNSERNLADQVEILRSTEAATIASDLTGGEIPFEEVIERRVISGDATSNLITIAFRANSPSRAKMGADSLLDTYSEMRRRQVQATAEAALAKLDALSAVIGTELEAINLRISALAAADLDRIELESQVDAAVRELKISPGRE